MTVSAEDFKTEVERWVGFYRRMRNVAAGYSNLVGDDCSTKHLDREFEAVEKEVGWPLPPNGSTSG